MAEAHRTNCTKIMKYTTTKKGYKKTNNKKIMQIKIGKPPYYDECVKAFGIDKRKGVVFTYGQDLWNPDNVEIPDHLFEHELVHCAQQGGDNALASIWWRRYIDDSKFRVDQEIEAYKKQYQFICTKIKDRNARFRALHILAVDMSSPMYGSSISYTDAIRRIRGN